MKKIFFVGILSILSAGISFAQQPKIGVTAGLNVSNITVSGGGTSNKFKAGFQAGVVADVDITDNFSIIPELLFGQRGCKSKVNDTSMTLNYLQLPINAAYKFDVGYGSQLLVFAGPYFVYGVSATNAKFGSNAGELKPFDFGINAGVGYQFEKIFFKLQCNPGLVNLSNYNGGSSVKNMNIAVTAGYYFF